MVDIDKAKKLKDILLAPTPIAHRMLLASWNDLNFESQCEILLQYEKVKGHRLWSYSTEIRELALKSPFPLVRYLGSKICGEKDGKSEIANDSHPLVSSSNMRFGCSYFNSIFDDASKFLLLTQDERIENLSYCSNSGGKFYELMSLVKDKIEQQEAYELVLAYLTNPYVKRQLERDFSSYGPDMGLNWYSDGKERESLWKLTALFPDLEICELLPRTPAGENIESIALICPNHDLI